jgi:hypothetical protein
MERDHAVLLVAELVPHLALPVIGPAKEQTEAGSWFTASTVKMNRGTTKRSWPQEDSIPFGTWTSADF